MGPGYTCAAAGQISHKVKPVPLYNSAKMSYLPMANEDHQLATRTIEYAMEVINKINEARSYLQAIAVHAEPEGLNHIKGFLEGYKKLVKDAMYKVERTCSPTVMAALSTQQCQLHSDIDVAINRLVRKEAKRLAKEAALAVKRAKDAEEKAEAASIASPVVPELAVPEPKTPEAEMLTDPEATLPLSQAETEVAESDEEAQQRKREREIPCSPEWPTHELATPVQQIIRAPSSPPPFRRKKIKLTCRRV